MNPNLEMFLGDDKIMNKAFNPSIKEVASIGDELRFQREYYCYKNNISLPLKIDSSIKENDERDSLQDVLYNYMQNNIGENSEMATSYDVLYAIENGKSKKKNENYNPNAYFLRMFCLFKIYGFLDSMTILEILKDKYNLEPSFASSKNIIEDFEKNYTLYNLIHSGRKGKVIRINIKEGKARCSKDTYLKFCNESEKEEINKMYNEVQKEERYATFSGKEFPIELFNEFKELFKKERQLLINLIEKLLKKGDEMSLIEATQRFINVSREIQNNEQQETLNYKRFIENYNNWINKGSNIIKKIKIENPEDTLMFGYIFTKEKKELQCKMAKLSQLERYCTSLELGRDTSYIDSFINNTLQNINIDTLLRTLEYFDMKDYKFYEILNIIKRDFSYESMIYSNMECF